MTSYERFHSILSSIERDCKIDNLLAKIESSDFLIAPSSTQYNYAYQGGLLDHCLAIYEKLKLIRGVDDDSTKICGLLSEIYKMNFYEDYLRNIKVNDEWKQKPSYKVMSIENRFIYGSNHTTSEFMIRHYIPLTLEESVAILALDTDFTRAGSYDAFNKYTLPSELYAAHMLATFNSTKK